MTEQVALFPSFWTPLHPLALRHELHALTQFGDEGHFRVFFNFNYFFSTLFGEEDACVLIHTSISLTYSRSYLHMDPHP